MNRPGTGRVTAIRPGYSNRVSWSWGPVLTLALAAALVSAVAVWLLLPRTPDAFSAVGNALKTGAQPASGPDAPLVYRALSGASAGQVSQLPTPVPVGSSADTIALPSDVIGSDVAKAYETSDTSTIAVEIAGKNAFAVAPVTDAGGPSAVPVLVMVAFAAALAVLGGALLARRRSRWGAWTAAASAGPASAGPASAAPAPASSAPASSALPPPGTERIASLELRRLRRGAQQRAALARNVAELLSSMPEALYWQVERALAEAGVRAIVPDGQPFDPAVHHAVGTEPVAGGARENTIARTVRPGYADDDSILVYPKVVVYANDAGGHRP